MTNLFLIIVLFFAVFVIVYIHNKAKLTSATKKYGGIINFIAGIITILTTFVTIIFMVIQYDRAEKYFQEGKDYQQIGINHMQSDTILLAIKSYNKAIELNSKHVAAHHFKGKCHYALEEPQKAIDAYSKAININENAESTTSHIERFSFTDVYNDRGLAYFSIEDFINAINDFNNAIQLDPGYVEAYYNLGKVYHVTGDYDNALAKYEIVIEKHPLHLYVFCDKGDALDALGKYDEAIEAYRKSLDNKPDNKTAWYSLKLVESKKGKIEADEYRQKAKEYKAQGYSKKALEYSEKADSIMQACYNQALAIHPPK